MRRTSDEMYVLDLCDSFLGCVGTRQHRFPFLVGDSGRRLPVDAFYSALCLVVEYRERQHSEPVKFFDRRATISGMSRGEQRKLYDERRRKTLPKHGLVLVELDFSEFPHDSRRKLKRTAQDADIVARKLEKYASAINLSERTREK